MVLTSQRAIIVIFFKIKIPIPSLEKQQTIVAYLDFIYEKANKTSFTKIEELKQLNEFCLNNQKLFGEYVVKELGEVFKYKMGRFNSNDMDNNGIIPFYSCKSNNPVGFHSTYSFDHPEYLLLVCAGGSQNNIIGDDIGLGKCYYVTGKTACRANVCSLVSKTGELNIKYIHYYLNINRIDTNKKAHFTTNLGTISLDEIKSIKIPIPSLEKQQTIVAYCDANNNLIKQLENEIEHNKNLAQQFIKGIVKNVGVEVEEEEE